MGMIAGWVTTVVDGLTVWASSTTSSLSSTSDEADFHRSRRKKKRFTMITNEIVEKMIQLFIEEGFQLLPFSDVDKIAVLSGIMIS